MNHFWTGFDKQAGVYETLKKLFAKSPKSKKHRLPYPGEDLHKLAPKMKSTKSKSRGRKPSQKVLDYRSGSPVWR